MRTFTDRSACVCWWSTSLLPYKRVHRAGACRVVVARGRLPDGRAGEVFHSPRRDYQAMPSAWRREVLAYGLRAGFVCAEGTMTGSVDEGRL